MTMELADLRGPSGPRSDFSTSQRPDTPMKATDTDSHIPGFYIIRKTRTLSHADYHSRSEAGKEHDAERRKEKKGEKTMKRSFDMCVAPFPSLSFSLVSLPIYIYNIYIYMCMCTCVCIALSLYIYMYMYRFE